MTASNKKPHTLFMNLGQKPIPYWAAHPHIGHIWDGVGRGMWAHKTAGTQAYRLKECDALVFHYILL